MRNFFKYIYIYTGYPVSSSKIKKTFVKNSEVSLEFSFEDVRIFLAQEKMLKMSTVSEPTKDFFF